jgi:hypothetical protein
VGCTADFVVRRRGLFFRLEEGRLVKGDTVTIIYGDTRGGSPGFRVQTFSNDAFPLPIYVNLRGNRELITLPIQTYTVRGGKVNGVHGFAPSVVKTGEAFTLSVRSEDFYYNREHEIRNVRVASKAGLAPKLLHVVDGVQVSEFVAGKSLQQGEPVQDATIIAVAELLRSMHELSLPDDYHSFDMVRIARRQLGELQPGTLGDTDLRKLHAVRDRAPLQIPQGLIHADLLPENFIDDGERHWLVDWEYGGRGDPALDLANLSAGSTAPPRLPPPAPSTPDLRSLQGRLRIVRPRTGLQDRDASPPACLPSRPTRSRRWPRRPRGRSPCAAR